MSPAGDLLARMLDRLCCPVCRGALALVEAGIDCQACGRRYPIVDGLPVLIGTCATLPQKG